MRTTRRTIPILILLTVGPCAVHGQSIVVSGGQRSIMVSGQQAQQPRKPVESVPATPEPKKGVDPVSPSPVANIIASVPSTATGEGLSKPQPAVTRQVRQERYLVSESWCRFCPAAKAQFLRSGGKPENVITIQQAQQMGHRWSGGVPHEFTMEIVVEAPASKPAPQVITQPQATLPARYFQYGSQMIDLETYGGCDSRHCGMCRTIRAQQAQYRAAKQAAQYRPTSIELPDHQQPTPPELIGQVIDELQLSPSDVLADLGCGDGRILIAAVQRYGCRAVGIEIDPARADVARAAVQAAGLQDKIEIITGDALEFRPEQHGITAATVYLYPDLLEQLRPTLDRIPLVVSPCHEVPGMQMERRGDVWIKRLEGRD